MLHLLRPLRFCTPLLLLAPLCGCANPAWRFSFDPSPAETLVQPRAQEAVVARVLTSVIEGRRAEDRSTGAAHMHLRLLVENRSDQELRLLSEGMKLVGSGLEAFGSPNVEPLTAEPIPAGETRTYELYFPYPAGMPLSAPELDGLNLSWSIAYPGGTADITQTFVRRAWQRGYYYDEPDVRWSFFFVGRGC